ncbi:MAG: PQQ-binding-like beta-propeller repeat protein [Pseudomonadota bacterium]
MRILALLLVLTGVVAAPQVRADDDAGGAKRVRRPAPAAAAVIDREALPGAPVYHIVCAQCHDKAVFKAPAKSFLSLMAPDTIYEALAHGQMREQASKLTDQQKHEVAEYVGDAALAESLRAAKPPMCAKNNRSVDLKSPPRLYGWGASLDNSHSIPADIAGLTAGQIPHLKLKWAFAYPAAQRARSQPTVAMGTLFVGSQDGTVYALDANSGCVRWTFRASVEVRTPIVLSHDDTAAMHAHAPVAFFGDLIGRAYAIDATNGKLLWKSVVDDHPTTTITGAPVYHEGRVYVPVSSLEEAATVPGYECCTFRGSVIAFDALTGKQLWKRYTIDEAPAPAGTTKTGTRILAPSGAAVWNSPTIDAKRGVLYVGTGDNYSAPSNDRSDAVIAMDLKTGEIRWTHQMVAGDAWNVGCVIAADTCPLKPGPDFDIGAGTILVHAKDGRDLVVAGLKSGDAIALDVDNPTKAVWSTRLGRGGIEGGIQFALAHDADSVYVPVADMQVHDNTTPGEPQHPGLYALDPQTGSLKWSAETINDRCAGKKDCDAGILSAVTVIPGAVFAGHMDGRFRAYDTATGKVLWEVDTLPPVKTTSGVMASGGSIGGGGPMVVGGTVYVNSGYGIYWHMPGNVLLAFSVDGK